MPKDLFSNQSEKYANFRPVYPEELYEFIFSQCRAFDHAWDCATGNGQVAQDLAKKFVKVEATDISQKQLNKAHSKENISYEISAAERSPFPDDSFDLITVGQAIHWFELESFFKEAQRVLKPQGILSFWGYGLLRVNPEIDKVIDHFYHKIIGSYWDEERRHIETEYDMIKTPFKETSCPRFEIEVSLSKEQLIGYLSSWSSVERFKKVNEQDPLDLISNDLNNTWKKDKPITGSHPIFLRICQNIR